MNAGAKEGPIEYLSGSPADHMATFGPDSLRDVELVAAIVGGADRAARVLASVGGVRELQAATVRELSRVDGVGMARASALVAAFELGRRATALRSNLKNPLRTPRDAAAYLRATIGHKEQEHFLALGLDARQRVIAVHTVAVGSLSSVEVHPREVFRPLIRAGVHSVILAHNHPTGNVAPSDADLELTKRLTDVGQLVGILVLDHIIAGGGEHCSLASMGLIP